MTTTPREGSGRRRTSASSSSPRIDPPAKGEGGGKGGGGGGPSNEYVLNVAFLSFASFVLLQTAFALVARSRAMMADSMAMAVDALTYLFNMVAERLKGRPMSDDDDGSMPLRVRRMRHRRRRLYLELFPPLISVTALIGVSIWVLADAVRTLFAGRYHPPVGGPTAPDEEEEDAPNASIMLGFSALNLLLDVVNVTCFAKAGDFGFGTALGAAAAAGGAGGGAGAGGEKELMLVETRAGSWAELGCDVGGSGGGGAKADGEGTHLLAMSGGCPYGHAEEKKDEDLAKTDEDPFGGGEEEREENLNMCSAYTHVMADTLRSLAVVITASLATLVSWISPETADASGAIIVSFIIAASLGPLFAGLMGAWSELRDLDGEGGGMMSPPHSPGGVGMIDAAELGEEGDGLGV